MIADCEGGGQLQCGVGSGNGPAQDDLSAGKREYRSVVYRQIADAAFRQKDHRGSKMRRHVRLAAGYGQHNLSILILQLGYGDLLTVQRCCDHRRYRQGLIRGTLIRDLLSAGLPGQRLSIQCEGFISGHVFNTGQHGAVSQNVQLLRVFQPNTVGQTLNRAVCVEDGVNTLMPGVLRKGCYAAHHHDQRNQCRNYPFIHHDLPFFPDQRAAFISKVV